MAIDTAAKQMAMLNFWDGANIHVLPIPDGAYSAPDQQHLLDLYSGIAFGSPPVAVTGTAKHAQGTLVGLKHMMGM